MAGGSVDESPAGISIALGALAAIPEEMGLVLRRTAFSPNIKERMDASCALFDPQCRLLAQAEHIPVHLGSMPQAVASVARFLEETGGAGTAAAGDQVLLNNPYLGGSHLPDLTLVGPVVVDGRLIGYVANKAHHADIGGIAPGSMPVGARLLEEEGIVIDPVHLVRSGAEVGATLHRVAEASRTPVERAGDLRAQVAANALGARRLAALAGRWGSARLEATAGFLIDYARRRARAGLGRLKAGSYTAEDWLEGDGVTDEAITIRATLTAGNGRLLVDFEGTAPASPGNLNCPPAVTIACTAYVLRLLVGPDVPSNHGSFMDVEVRAPEGTVVNPRPPSAVAAGNVETSQRIVDVLLAALAPALPDRVPAQSQGTMNNVLIGGTDAGGRPFSYYETVGGGQGAWPFRDGMSGVQVHMTNTANTPAESLEIAYPLRVERYELLPGSGGQGRHRGGDGIRRAVRFLGRAGQCTLLTERRRRPPGGLAGGQPGRSGRNLLERRSERRELPSKATVDLQPDDLLIVETPGGGGWGRAEG